MKNGFIAFAIVLGLIGTALSLFAIKDLRGDSAKMGFVNTQKVMTGFRPAYAVEKELNDEDQKFRDHVKILEDSLKTMMDSMSVKFDKANPEMKKKMQDLLASKNQELNNLERAHSRRMEQERQTKMQSVYDKINVYMSEYGKKNRYAIIFGTVQGGNILYGEGTKADITQEIVDGLNERYK